MRLLILDWDVTRCHVVVGEATRGKVEVERALVWEESELVGLENAEELGKKLREFLKTAGVQPAPVVVCLGRERVLLKELRYPPVAAADEPALVRFQATKDLVDGLGEMVLDYATLPRSGSEARALIAVVRKDLLKAYESLCRVAGLKLHGMTARPFALVALRRALGTAEDPAGILWLGRERAELTIVSGEAVLFARSFDMGSSWEQDVRRNLAVYASGAQEGRVASLQLIGEGASAEIADRLSGRLAIPVRRAEALANATAAARGMLECWSREPAAIDFVHPKQERKPEKTDRSKWVLTAGVAVLALVGLAFVGMYILSSQREDIQRQVERKEQAQANLKRLEQESADLDALKEWDRTTVAWIDEFYDLAARFPDQAGFHLTKVQAEPIAKRNAKEKYVARLNVNGIAPAGKDALTHQFLEALRDDHLLARVERLKGGSANEFFFKVELGPQKAKDYAARLNVATGGGR